MKKVIMEQILIEKNINKQILTEDVFLKQNLIFEDIYLNDIFNDLIDFIIYNYQHLISEYFDLNTEKIKSLLPDIVKGKKYFKKDKKIYVLITNFIKYNFQSFNYSTLDIERIQKNLLTSNSFLISNLDCLPSNESILFLDEKIFQYNILEFRKSIIHELIHVFQWITGRSIYDVLKNKEIEITDEEEQDINNCFHTKKPFDLNKIFNALLDKYEIADYCQQIYYELKKYLSISDLRLFFKNLTKINLSFSKRFNLINNYAWFKNLKINYQLLLLLAAHYKLGINTIKNHIYGYYFKEGNN